MAKMFSQGLLVFMTLLSMYFYYIYYPIHGTSKEGFVMYLLIMWVVYWVYKTLQSLTSEKRIVFNFVHLIGVFLLHLLIVCCLFFAFSGLSLWLWVWLFLKISFFLFCIWFFWFICYSFWRKLLEISKYFIHVENHYLQHMISLGLGFSLYILWLYALTALWHYNFYSVIILLFIAWVIWYEYILWLFHSCKSPVKSYNLKENTSYIALIIDEIQYIVITFLLSVNFLSVFRPFPIGWDDLGVYMNWPKLLSGAWELLPLGQMYFWQLYTGIWFLAGSQTFAFFLNSFSGIIVSIVIYLSIRVLLPQNKKSSYDYGLFAVIIILMMPMSVFQLAKDMKLDYGLLSMSIIALTTLYHTIFFQENISKNYKSLVLIGLSWFFIGIAFSIKLTSLLLIVSALALLAYRNGMLLWFFGFFLVFIWVFTWANLWSMMNVIGLEWSWSIKNIFSISSILWGLFLLIYSSFKDLQHYINSTICLILGFLVALLPWGIKNIYEVYNAGDSISVRNMISGVPNVYVPNYENIYSQSELEEINAAKEQKVTKSWVTTNEDFGRYFGYEKGINNYLKLPWNLTFQTNQAGEFTDITFIFFALIPLIFIFLPYKKDIYKWPIVGVQLILLSYFIPGPISGALTSLFSQIYMPLWYIPIVGFFFLPLIYLYNTLDTSKPSVRFFLANYTFGVVYVFLWDISAFWIVWYGILMYFVFILMILGVLKSLEHVNDEENYRIVSYIVLFVVWTYVFISAIPHGLKNIKTAGYHEYKLGYNTEEASIMKFHRDYLPILWELNIDESQKAEVFTRYRNELLGIIDAHNELQNIRQLVVEADNIVTIHNIFLQLERTENFDINMQARDVLQSMYMSVIYPEYPSDVNIYRAGTFLQYFITRNNERLLQDNILEKFWWYLYDENPNTIKERFKDLDLSYILLDLNAATIDNDSRKALTTRYENMLKFTLLADLELIETDSICLKLWRDYYKKNSNIADYMILAGSNYDSSEFSRSQKRSACVTQIVNILQNETVDENNYPYLQVFMNLLNQAGIPISDTEKVTQWVASRLPIWYKALFKIQK